MNNFKNFLIILKIGCQTCKVLIDHAFSSHLHALQNAYKMRAAGHKDLFCSGPNRWLFFASSKLN